MTRINCVPPSELSRQHLIAEYRELPRLYRLIARAVERGEARNDPRNPRQYVLGKGHVRFFYDKVAWLVHRQWKIYKEMKARGYNPKFRPSFQPAYRLPTERYRWWEPDEAALKLNRERIAERTKA